MVAPIFVFSFFITSVYPIGVKVVRFPPHAPEISVRHVAAKKGKNPTCGFSLFSPAEKIHPFLALSNDRGISPSAEGDQGFAFGNHELFGKGSPKTFNSARRADHTIGVFA